MIKTANKIVGKLQKKGFQAFFAGGFVRDLLLNRKSHDIDIATSAKPEEVEEIFDVTIPVGKQFGVIIVVEDGASFEVATFRGDGVYQDGRRPSEVFYTDAEEDAQRRDFTVNALFFDPGSEKVIDFVDGQRDLENRIIRFVGNAEDRIKEDHLRVLRAVRFKNKLNFSFHPDTFKSLKKNPKLLKKISPERISEELSKILKDPSRIRAFWDLLEIGILDEILPELAECRAIPQPWQFHTEGDVFAHTMLSLESIKHPNPSLELLWAILLHDIGKAKTYEDSADRIRFSGHDREGAELARKILRRLKFPRKLIEKISWGIQHHMILSNVLKMRTAKKRRWLLEPHFPFLLSILRADTYGTRPSDFSLFRNLRKMRREVKKKFPNQIPKIISGFEVMEILNMKSGKAVGEVLEQVKEQQILGKIRSKNGAKKFLLEKYGKS